MVDWLISLCRPLLALRSDDMFELAIFVVHWIAKAYLSFISIHACILHSPVPAGISWDLVMMAG